MLFRDGKRYVVEYRKGIEQSRTQKQHAELSPDPDEMVLTHSGDILAINQ